MVPEEQETNRKARVSTFGCPPLPPMTHINSLPTELLSYIFYLVYKRTRRSTSSLANLLLVSSRWHQVAVTSPSLWTYIPLTEHTESSEGARKAVERSLLRSKGCSLDILIRLPYDVPSESLKEAAKHAHRWRTLCVDRRYPESARILERLYLPRLFSLTFVPRLNPEYALKLNTPNLKEFEGLPRESDGLRFAHPLPIFTKLVYSKSSHNTEQLVSHLRRSQSSLDILSLSFVTPPGRPFSILPDGGTQVSPDTLDLSFTALTEYTVKFESGAWDWSVLHIGHMPALRHLTIYWSFFQDVALTSTIPFMPQLITLQVSLDHGRRFKQLAPELQSAMPNVQALWLDQTFPSISGNDSIWLSPLKSEDQDNAVVAWPKLAVLRLCRLIIPRWEELKSVALGRPAFKMLSIDSACWRESKGGQQDLDVLERHFGVHIGKV